MFFLTFVFLITTAFATVFQDPPCPDLQKTQNLNLSNYDDSTWYEIARYPNEFELREQCWSINYKMEGSILIGTINDVPRDASEFYEMSIMVAEEESLHNSVINVVYGVPQKTVTFETRDLSAYHDQFDVYYSCEYDDVKKTRQEYAWVYGKYNVIKEDVRSVVESVIDSYSFLDVNKFIWIDNSAETCRM